MLFGIVVVVFVLVDDMVVGVFYLWVGCVGDGV